VIALANDLADPATCPVLDIGAGTGRNALALARRGHPVDAVELSGQFAAILRDEAQQQSLPLQVIERDIFASWQDLRRDYSLVVLSEVTSDFCSTIQLRLMFETAAQCLAPGGVLVFNIFLPRLGYAPDVAARQLGLQVYTSIFTYPEVASAASGLPLALVADDSVYCYEQSHLAKSDWPPTSWYADWVSGLDVFDVSRLESPIEMRWLVYCKTAV
jgi:SAM-dependent methyltransferase